MEGNKTNNVNLKEIRLDKYILRGHSLYVLDESEEGKKEKFLAHAAKIKRVIRYIESRNVVLEIEFFSFGNWETLRINRGKLVLSEVSKLLSHGMDVAGFKAKPVLQFLDYHEKTVTPDYEHQELGWILLDGKLTFRLQQAIQVDGKFSEYSGYYSLKPTGSYEEWNKIIKEEVIGHTPLEMVLSASFAAPIAAMLDLYQKADIDSLLFHIMGNSTTGKTTAAYVAVSPFGSPSITNNGLIQSFNGTTNALQALISGNFGIPIVFDETSMNTMSQSTLTSFVYKLAQNKEKARLNKESELRETLYWCTVIFFTGESSMLSKTSNNEGLRVRLFEFKNIQWTKNGEHAERIKTGLAKNYGQSGRRYVEHLLKVGIEVVESKWNEYKSYMLRKMPDTKFKNRIAGKFATILTGAYFANEALDLELSVEDISDLLIKQELESMEERELAPKFYEQLKEKLIQYRKNFKLNNTSVEKNQEIWGKIETKNNKTYCFILPTIYEKLTEALGFTDSNVLLEELKKMNVLHHEKNKLRTRKAIFNREEEEQREKVLGEKKYSPKGDYTICIVYEGNIFEDYFESDEEIEQRLKKFNPLTSKTRKIAKQNTDGKSDFEELLK